MEYNILPYLATQAYPLTAQRYDAARLGADLGERDAETLDLELSFPSIMKHRTEGLMDLDENLNMASLFGYAVGVRRKRFGFPEEEYMLWNKISTDAVSDFRAGHAYSSRAADTSPSVSASELVLITMESMEDGLLPFSDSAALIGSLAGIHAVDLKKEMVA